MCSTSTSIRPWSTKGMLDKRYTNDGLHLMGEGYLAWKEVIEKYVK